MFEWMPSNDLIAQLAHAGWGAFIVVAFGLFGHFWWGALGVLLYATLKEFVFDKYIERQSFHDNLHDWIYWMVGLWSGVGLALIHEIILHRL